MLRVGDLVRIKSREELLKIYTCDPQSSLIRTLASNAHLVFRVVGFNSASSIKLTLNGEPCTHVGDWEIWAQDLELVTSKYPTNKGVRKHVQRG